jgi:uncharacterized protein YaaN involved in tellurite resistance
MESLEEEFLDSSTPVLTFEPFPEEKKEEIATILGENQLEEEEKPAFDESMLSPEERKMVEAFAEQIDVSNASQVMQYGAGAQKKVADFSETALNNVRTKDLGEVGDLLSGVVKELRGFDATEESRGIKGFFKKNTDKITSMKTKYDKAEVNVNKIVKAMEGHQIQLLKDSAMLDKMYEINKNYLKELTMYILAGKKKLKKLEQEELPRLIERSNQTGDMADAQAVNDFHAMYNRFEKKLHDLELTRTISLQMAPQIRMLQNNDIQMAEKIQSTLVNTIPLWKSQMVLALGIAHSGQAAKAQREVTDMTNELLKKNAAMLKSASIETAKESERGIVDIETLKMTNESLISTLDEVMKIQEEGRGKRQAAEAELGKIENDLKSKLLEMRK